MKKAAYLIVHKDYPVDLHGVNSGAETATLALARTLAKLGERVVVAAFLKSGKEEVLDGVQYWDLGSDFDVRSIIERARELGSYRLVAACRGAAVLVARHETACISRHFIAHDPSASALGMTAQVLCRLVDSVICVSEAQKELFVKEGGDASKIEVIPNGADRSIFKPTKFETRNLKRIVFAGALVMDKGIDLLIRAFQYAQHKLPGIELHVYGSSKMWGREALFDEKEVERTIPGIKFFGGVSQQQVAEAFGSAAVNVISSRWFDSFPLTAVEAQSTGCPIIAFDTGGIKEAFIPGKTGILVPKVDEKLLADALVELLSDTTKIRSMSDAALTLVDERFSWDRIAGRVVSLCEQTKGVATPNSGKRIGFLTTWNQECGLATYARFLVSELEKDTFVVLSEESPTNQVRADEEFVIRCWKKEQQDFSRVLREILRYQVGLLHINAHSARYFAQPGFGAFLAEARARGVKTVVHVHSTFTRDAHFAALVAGADQIVVHAAQNRLEMIANGAAAEQVYVLPHGVHAVPGAQSTEARAAARKIFGISQDEKAIVAFGFVQPHKGTEGVVEAVAHLEARGIRARGFVVGMANPDDQNSQQYLALVKQRAAELKVSDRVTFLDRFATEEEVQAYLAASDLVVMNYRSQHYEASGACSIAVGSGALVATSIAPPFEPFGDAVWHITAGYPVSLTAEALLTNSDLSAEIRARASAYSKENGWNRIATKLLAFYSEKLSFVPAAIPFLKAAPVKVESQERPFRVLMQNRPNTFTQRGGDTIVLERTAAELKKLGVDVTVDVELKADPSKFDLVHLFNFALPDMTRALGQRAKNAKVPFVVTTLYEDVPAFHCQSVAAAQVLIEYVARGQDAKFWEKICGAWSSVPAAKRFQNDWTAENAAAMLSCGETESETIRRDYPKAGKIFEVPFGFEVGAKGDAELFVREYGVKDFVLCVGRLESRKNQLMLLKALEHSTVPVVFAGGGFTYQPEYAEAVRRFKRAGKTIVLDKLTPEMLASAYAAARVHILPSWYELPGLVTLEAAAYGCAVVATDCGTIRNYLGNSAYYCDPGNPESIRSAVEQALRKEAPSGLYEAVQQFKWCEIGNRTIKVYEDVTGRILKASIPQGVTMATTQQQVSGNSGQPGAAVLGSMSLASDANEFEQFVAQGETQAKAGELDQAQESLEKAENINPSSVRMLKVRGTVFLAQNQTARAKSYFERARAIEPNDPRVLCGLGMCEVRKNSPETAHSYFVKALEIAPETEVAIMQLVACSHATGRFDDLERALRRYMQIRPDDLEMKYCLGGALLQMKRFAESETIAREILAAKPGQDRAQELMDLAQKGARENGSSASPRIVTPSVTSFTTTSSQTSSTAAAPARTTSALPPLEKIHTPQSSSAQSSIEVSTAFGNKIVSAASVEIDLELGSIEEKKRAKDFPAVMAGLTSILARSEVNADQRELAECIKAEVLVLQSQNASAEAMYRSVLDRNPTNARALAGRAVVAANENRWDEAQNLFERSLAMKPKYDLALAGLGLCAWQRGDLTGAWERFSQALDANPENVRALLGLVQIGYPLKRFVEVERAIRAYVDLHPADLEWVYSLAGCLFAQNKLDEAMEQLNQITLFRPNDERAHELRGMIDTKRSEATA